MYRINIYLLVFVVVLSTGIMGCTNNENTMDKELVNSDSIIIEDTLQNESMDNNIEGKISDEIEDENNKNADVIIKDFSIESRVIFDEEFSNILEDCYILGNPEQEYASKILITSNSILKEFQFINLVSNIDDKGNLIIDETSVIEKIDFIEADKQVVIIGDLGEILPAKAISFIDNTGNIQYYYLTLSGEDGHSILSKFEFENSGKK